MLVKLITFFFPWRIRRVLLNRWFGYKIHPAAAIGWAWVFPKELIMAQGAIIDHFTVAINLDRIVMGEQTIIGRNNWITGFPTNTDSLHFKHQTERKAELVMENFSSITKKHHFDCTNSIHIGAYATIAGYNSQFLTHSIDVHTNRQDSKPILIGEYTFVGTNVVVLGGAKLPSRSVLGAKSLLNKQFNEEWTLYGGVPAKGLSPISHDAKYFLRSDGFVH